MSASNQRPEKFKASMAEFMAAPQGEQLSVDAFTRNIIWRPGVAFMANLPFTVKALVISVLFVVPLVLASVLLLKSQREDLAFTEQELQGVVYLKDVLPVLESLTEVRRHAVAQAASGQDSPALGTAKAALQSQMEQLQQTDARMGVALGTSSALRALETELGKLPAVSAGADTLALLQGFQPAMDAANAVLNMALDRSNLILDPATDTYFLMDVAYARLPALAETVAQIREVTAPLAHGAEASVARKQLFSAQNALGDYMDPLLQGGVDKVVGLHPEWKPELSVDEPMHALHQFHELSEALLAADSKASMGQMHELADKAVRGFGESQRAALKHLEALLLQRAADSRFAIAWQSGLIVLCTLLAGYFFHSFYIVTQSGLQIIRRHLNEMAEGDLRHAPAQPWGRDEPAQLIMDLRKTYDAQHALIRKVRHSARALHAAAHEISVASQDLSSRTEESAASLQMQAQAMDEIGATVNATAERATMASTFGDDNSKVAQQGGQVFGEVVSTMRDIHSSSSKIADIISVIDGIAFQTNILALNAAVEAARAGESGRGFAVVATEVRSLAGRSAAAASEIKALIAESVNKVQEGTKVVESAGQSMSEVVNNAQQINTFLADISLACREQAVGVNEAGRSISALDGVTQQNAALAEETTAAATELRRQADILQAEIANFRVA